VKDEKPYMKNGDVVLYRDRTFHVGTNMTNTSIELLELNEPAKGWWVCRDEVYPASPQTQISDEGSPVEI